MYAFHNVNATGKPQNEMYRLLWWHKKYLGKTVVNTSKSVRCKIAVGGWVKRIYSDMSQKALGNGFKDEKEEQKT